MIPQPSNERPTITSTAKRNESLLPAGAALRAAASQANTCLVLFTPGGELKDHLCPHLSPNPAGARR